MTGCSSGIGIETGRAVAATGAKVFLGARNVSKAQEACGDFLEADRVEIFEIDTSSQESVKSAAKSILDKTSTVNVLINNAGVMMNPTREDTVDGYERQLATNYLGHFRLFYELKEAMIAASTAQFNSRLVNVSSSGHHASEIVFDDMNLEKDGAYTPAVAYGQSKLANIYHSNYVDRHFGTHGIHATSLMPGGILTNLQQYFPQEVKDGWNADPAIMSFMKSPAQGAATTVWAAVSKDWEGTGGKYLEDCAEAKLEGFVPGLRGRKEYTYDEAKEDRLWEDTVKMLGL